MKKKTKNNLQKLVVTAMLSAVSFVLFLYELPPLVPAISHLKLDLSDIPALFACVAYGPWTGVVIEFIKNLLELIFKGVGTQMGFGNLMNFIVGCAYIVPFALVYRKMKSTKGILLASAAGLLSILVVGVGANYLVTPLFFKFFLKIDLDSTTLWAAIGAATLTNLIKGVMLSVVSVPLIRVLLERLRRYIR
ncbi:MAG: ECF transporter S component [Clostridia bacterium]|nr:ECF transporter S component [Clostridia bacterium]